MGKEIHGFGNVEGQKQVSSSDCKIRRASHTLVDCNTVSPHDGHGCQVPPGLVTITSLEQHLAHVKVCPFSNPICIRVVTRNANVSDMIVLGEVVKCFHECRVIVGDDFAKCAPLAKDVFKDPVT